ncbi:MAG TPA: 4-hydroxyphenylpyruvate dioxygenase [Casimicrobiaceae bacterium]|jgi:4-hydroxyphenylpyruvate dioxygenase|nr:4-hydroxyphenylpyruvate dioxygenase [Casimicrobiaceae bacterium]
MHERNPEPSNPLGMDGIEFIEYATSQPQALGAVLLMMGFALVARHRSREVMLYRQGSMNVIVNAHPEALPGMAAPATHPALSAVALRVRDAEVAWRRALDLGAWAMPTRASVMELNIPGIHGVGDSLIYFVDRYHDFSIYDVDFLPIPGAAQHPPALAGMHWFGLVQSVYPDRSRDWVDFYTHLFGFAPLPGGQYFGILPKGTLLKSACGKFYLQLIEPPSGAEDIDWEERLLRVGIGAPDIAGATRELRERGVVFVDRAPVQPSDKGALTQIYMGSVTFELVKSDGRAAADAGGAA